MSYLAWMISVISSILDTLQLAFRTRSPIEYLEVAAAQAKTYEEWLNCQMELDGIQGKTRWLSNPTDRHYDWRALLERLHDIEHSREKGDNRRLAAHLRSHSSRNMFRILSPSLYQVSRIKTKLLIHRYLHEIRGIILHLARRESMLETPNVATSQDKRQLFNDVRQGLGRTSLVLQGGATFSMCHLGIVKALHLQGLLPQIITGTATGALVSALACTTPDSELLHRLSGDDIDLSAFVRAKEKRNVTASSSRMPAFFATAERRVRRFLRTGHLFDIDVLQECIRDNIGDATFLDAYTRTGRILNVTVALSDVAGIPQLLNYITAPHVFVWSAAVASIATSKMMYAPVSLQCRDENGNSVPYFASDASTLPPRFGRAIMNEPPLKRIGELFNVNHFILAQTRPYIVPFVRLQESGSSYFSALRATFFHLLFNEALHWLSQLGKNGYLPAFFGRLLLDETFSGGSTWSKMTITPDLRFRDLADVFEIPTAKSLDKWSLRGERSIWPAVCELRVRCGTEFELDAAYESVRRRGQGQARIRPA